MYTSDMPPITIIPRSLEPRQVNANQQPVFSLRVRNETRTTVEILPETKFWATDYEEAAGRGFFTFLESSVAIPSRREAVLRFRPTRIDVPGINAGVYPARLNFATRIRGIQQAWNDISPENCIRINGYGGIQPVDGVGFFLPPGPVIVSRSGGYVEATISMRDMFPIDLTLKWTNPHPDWQALTDDRVDMVRNPETVLRQTRAWTCAGVWIAPSERVPANSIQIAGTLIAVRCPFGAGAGLSACVGAGARVFAVIAESAEVRMQMVIPDKKPVVPRGGTIDIQATLENPFEYKVDIANYGMPQTQVVPVEQPADPWNSIEYRVVARPATDRASDPVGIRALQGGAEVDNAFELDRTFAPDYLRARESLTITWRLRVANSIVPGEYTLQAFTTATVWMWDRLGVHPKLESKIDPCLGDSNAGVVVNVV